MADKCAHEVCFCEPANTEYCGAHCAAATRESERHPTCECGHIDCEEATMRVGGVYTTASR